MSYEDRLLDHAERIQHLKGKAAIRQPKPTRTKPGVEVLPEVMKDLAARIETGIIKYGEPLTTNNGRDALLDAYQEALDLAVYLKQAILERGLKGD